MNIITKQMQEVRYEKVITDITPLHFPTENVYIKFGHGTLACIAPITYEGDTIGLTLIKVSPDKISKEYFPEHEILNSPLTKNEDLIELKRIIKQKDWFKYDITDRTTFYSKIYNLIDEINNL